MAHPLARVGDPAFCPADAHPEANCVVPVSGHLIKGSTDSFCDDLGIVLANSQPDHVHMACPGPTQKFLIPPPTDAVLYVNDFPAALAGDQTMHDGTGFTSVGHILPLCSLDTFA